MVRIRKMRKQKSIQIINSSELFQDTPLVCFETLENYKLPARLQNGEAIFTTATMSCKNIGTNHKFCRKIALF